MTEIISLVLNLLLGGGFIVTLVTLRSKKRKARTEASQQEVDLVTSSVNSMIESQKTLMSHNQDLIEALTVAKRENADLAQKIDDLEKKMNCMISTNRQIVKLLKKINVDDTIIKLLEDK